MSLATRLARLEMALLRDDRPALVVAFEDDDGRLVDAAGDVIDRDTLSPQTTLLIFSERPDGPQ